MEATTTAMMAFGWQHCWQVGSCYLSNPGQKIMSGPLHPVFATPVISVGVTRSELVKPLYY